MDSFHNCEEEQRWANDGLTDTQVVEKNNELRQIVRRFVIATEKLRRVENIETVPYARLDDLYQNVENHYKALRSSVLKS